MFDVKLAMYLGALIFSTGVFVAEMRHLRSDFKNYKKDRKEKDKEISGDIEGLRKRKATKEEVEKLQIITERDVNGIGKKVEDFRGDVKILDDREERRFRELALILGRLTDDPAIQGAIQHMAARNG